MKKLNLAFVLIIGMSVIFSCNKDESNTPIDPKPPIIIYQNSGIVDSIFYSGLGFYSQTKSLITSPYDFTAVDSVSIVFSYHKFNRDSTPVLISYIQGGNAIPFYTLRDTITFNPDYITVSVVVPSPKVYATIASTLRLTRQSGDPNAYTVLRNLTISKK